jgi:hypothetical protein
LACVLAGAATPLVIGPGAPVYQADALVVARQLAVSPGVLPDLAQNVFADGAVASAVAKDPAVHGDISSLIPDRISLVAGQDSIALDVQAFDADPVTAARLANLAAAAFVDELNRAAAGNGQFAVQSPAVVPTVPLDRLSPAVWAAAGAAAGLLLGLGIVVLLAALRRPVLTPDDVEQATGAPLLGTVRLPVLRRDDYPGPLGVPGIATLTRGLAGVSPGRLLVISAPADAGLRDRLFTMVAVAMWTVRPTKVAAPDAVVAAVRRHCQALRDTGRTPPEHGVGELILVDGGSPLDVLDPATTTVSVVAVVRRGIRRRALELLASDYANGGGLIGVALVRARTGLRPGARRTGETAPATAAEARPVHELPMPVPERA